MNTLKSIAEDLRNGQYKARLPDVELARQTGVTRQSISRALSGRQNFNVTTLLAIAESLELDVMLVPKDVSRALVESGNHDIQRVATMADHLRNL